MDPHFYIFLLLHCGAIIALWGPMFALKLSVTKEIVLVLILCHFFTLFSDLMYWCPALLVLIRNLVGSTVCTVKFNICVNRNTSTTDSRSFPTMIRIWLMQWEWKMMNTRMSPDKNPRRSWRDLGEFKRLDFITWKCKLSSTSIPSFLSHSLF